MLTNDDIRRVLETSYSANKAAYRVEGESIVWLVWEGGGTPPTYAQVSTLVAALPPLPDLVGFKAWIKANMAFTLRNKAEKTYPMFFHDLNDQNWPDFQAGCIEANNAVPLTQAQWTAFKQAVTTYSIPITLP